MRDQAKSKRVYTNCIDNKNNKLYKNYGFTLAELLVVVAIISVLVAIAIPIFSSQIEKSREAVDLANVRSAYAEVMAEAITTESKETISRTVQLKQQKDDWQSADPITIAGITHAKSDGDIEHWKGIPKASGICIISYNENTGVLFNWSGNNTNKAELSHAWTNDVHAPLNNTDILRQYRWADNLEIDAACPDSTMVPEVKKNIAKDSNCLLNSGTWAYLGSTKNPADRYLFWTSVDINSSEVGANKKVPVIIGTADGKYYVSASTTALRKNRDKEYTVIVKHVNSVSEYKKYIKNRTEYASLQEAYAAYEKELADNYPEYK